MPQGLGGNGGGGSGLWLWPGMSLGSLPFIWLTGSGLGGLKRGIQPRAAHTKPNELREMKHPVDQILGLVEQNKKESVAVQGPGTPAIKPKYLLGLKSSFGNLSCGPKEVGVGDRLKCYWNPQKTPPL